MTAIPLTFTYKTANNVDFKVDVHLPDASKFGLKSGYAKALPVLIHWHGGGLVFGTRDVETCPTHPTWLTDRAIDAGFVFVSPDYTLLSPHTGHDMLADVKDLVSWIDTRLAAEIKSYVVDTKSIVVSGSSAGGYLAYLTAIHAFPKPKAFVPLYAMGGNLLIDNYIIAKKEAFISGAPFITDPSPYLPLLNLQRDLTTAPLVSVEFSAASDPRLMYYCWLLQSATMLDVITGVPGLSESLSGLPLEQRANAVPTDALALIPSLASASSFPPTIFVHGSDETSVSILESQTLYDVLKANGRDVEFVETKGGEHGYFEDEGLKKVLPFMLQHV
ncbi:alpha/beta-hydrolase [Hymenopellis radicata]|nr:alpha/beta-hydrolase [Hymenopellis radicata]